MKVPQPCSKLALARVLRPRQEWTEHEPPVPEDSNLERGSANPQTLNATLLGLEGAMALTGNRRRLPRPHGERGEK